MAVSRFATYAVCSLALALFNSQLAAAQDDELVNFVLEQISNPDKEMRSIGFEMIRSEANGTAATRRYAEQLSKVPLEAQVGLISALADRGDTSAKSAILDQLKSKEESVRIAAIRAIAKLGDTSDCPQLTSMLEESPAEQNAAKTSLIQIQGDGITQAIAGQVAGKKPETQVAIIEILTARRAFDAIPSLLEFAAGSEATVRSAAMKSLGSIARAEHIPTMVQCFFKASGRSERADAERNLAAVCNRIEDPEARAEPLLTAIGELDGEKQIALLGALGRVGGAKALARIKKALGSDDGATHSAGVSALAKWPNASVATQLTDLANNDAHISHQLTALRALIRVAPLNDGRSNEEKLTLLKQAMRMSIRYADRNYAIQRGGAIRIVETLRWVLPFTEDPPYAESACRTIVELAHIRDLRDDNKEEFHAALDRVMATSKNAEVLERADRYKKGQTWVRPKK